MLPGGALGGMTVSSGVKASQVATLEEQLSYCGGGFCAGFSIGGRRFRGVVDTGSPFVLVSTCKDSSGEQGECARYCRAWGCSTSGIGEPSGLADTDEVFAAGSARVAWRLGSLGIGGANLGNFTYGTMLEVESYGGNGGGAFLGFIRKKADRIRPTFLGQASFRTLTVDLRTPGRELLRLSAEPLKPTPGIAMVPLVDLREVGAPVCYYAVVVKALKFAGELVELPGNVVGVLDTGTTGLSLPPALFERYDAMRRAKAGELGLRGASTVDVMLQTSVGEAPVVLSMRQGRMAAYGGAAFDIVTPIPEPSGMDADAAALWAGASPKVETLEVRGGSTAVSRQGQKRGQAQGDKPIIRGEHFRVRVFSANTSLVSVTCDVAIGLAARGTLQGRPLAETEGASVYSSGSLVQGRASGSLVSGDVIECGLTDDGEVYWRINDGPSTWPRPLDTTRLMFPTIEAGWGCAVQLLELSGGKDANPQWAEAPVQKLAERPLVIFLGLGFLLGRSMSIDTVADRAMFLT